MRVIDADPANLTLFVVPVEADADGKREQKKTPLKLAYSVTAFEWSPDSKSIAFAHQPTVSANDWMKSDIAELTLPGPSAPTRRVSAAHLRRLGRAGWLDEDHDSPRPDRGRRHPHRAAGEHRVGEPQRAGDRRRGRGGAARLGHLDGDPRGATTWSRAPTSAAASGW